ncbi:MAG: hypothetical protein OEX81_02200 [Candidatus Pacebacteria bacterium]|nr:hypothetical protein [Candidatus Paceibacterota bacterium]
MNTITNGQKLLNIKHKNTANSAASIVTAATEIALLLSSSSVIFFFVYLYLDIRYVPSLQTEKTL